MKQSQILGALMLLALNPAGADVPTPTLDFSAPEAGEHLPGGAATHAKTLNKNAFSHPSANMSFERELDFKVGNGFFKRLWVSAPASTDAADGLGPLYNARSCQRCHIKDGRGHPPAGPDDNAVSMFLRLSVPPTTDAEHALIAASRAKLIPEPTYGSQLQDFAIQGHRAEGRMLIDYQEIPVALTDGEVVRLRKPTYSVADLGYGPMHPDTMLSPRVAPQMIGLGLLETVPADDVLSLADPKDDDGDGTSGKPSRVWSREHGKVMLGRFGWKAGEPSVNEQSQAAFAGDIGISVPLHADGAGECTERQEPCKRAPNGNSPQFENLEASSEVTGLVVFYAKNLAVPARRDYDAPQVLAGKQLFYEIGCTACHNPKFRTRSDVQNPEQSDQLIWPYTDLLLHDMGEGLADGMPEGYADGREWRTAPLWGIGLTPLVNGHSHYLHDGRARSLLEAILWHGGEAQAQRDAVAALSQAERENLLRFIESL
jgi:CxxC motif-containing protein (DUF1111 family)